MTVFQPTCRPIRIRIAAFMSIAGAATLLLVLAALDGFHDPGLRGTLPSAAIGAGLAGYAFAGFFGHSADIHDWLASCIGAVLATLCGSALGCMVWLFGGLIFADVGFPSISIFAEAIPSSALFGVMVVMGLAPAEAPWTVIVWAVLMAWVQIAAVSVRRQARRTAACVSQNATARS